MKLNSEQREVAISEEERQKSLSSPKLPFNPPFFYGWIIVFMGALGMFFSGPGQTYTVSIFIESYVRDFGWSQSLIASMYSIATLVAGLFFFFVGKFVDRFGQRKMSVTIGMLLAFACFLNSFIAGATMLFIGFFMLRLFGQGSMTLIPGTLVPQWFVKQRGRALSLMALGGFVGSSSLPPLNAWLIESYGWSMTWQIWGIILACFYVPLAFFLIRNKPEQVGLLPDGQKNKSEQDKVSQSDQTDKRHSGENKSTKKEISWKLNEAMRTRVFWFILFCVGIPSMVNTGIVFHITFILGENGMNNMMASYILSLMAVVAFPVTFIAGFVVERIKVHWVLALTFIGQAVAMLVLLQVNTFGMAVLFGVIRGLVGGFEVICLGIIWPNYFGREHLGSIKGIAMTVTVIGSAFGPLPFGLAYDMFGGYSEIILLMTLFPLLGACAAFFSPTPNKAVLSK
ncbi:MFS transporter [Caldalkalibacillus salinus]|uniref:MFS transporter n=1 Tax=Caldalkalibacillus salinus TaxID=2803787 RepID=UPI001923C72B|nr:MFS transporter [Caldalkalibacillus salinus]